MFAYILLLFYCSTVISANLPCKIDDTSCLTKTAQEAFNYIIPGNPKLGATPLDPLHTDVAEGELTSFKFKLMDNIIIGFKDCQFKNVKANADKLHGSVEVFCPFLNMSGKYEVTGQLIGMPVEGTGDYTIISDQYEIILDVDTEQKTERDGKIYATIKNFKLNVKHVKGVKYDFRNLFNGQKELSDAFNNLANENWKDIADFVQIPVLSSSIKILIKICNKYLKTIPVDSYVQ